MTQVSAKERREPGAQRLDRTDARGDQSVVDGGLKLQAEEVGVVRVEGGIEVLLDGGEVVGVVFEAGVIALDGDGGGGDQK